MNQILANLQNTFEDDEPEVVVRFPPRAGAHHDVTTHPDPVARPRTTNTLELRQKQHNDETKLKQEHEAKLEEKRIKKQRHKDKRLKEEYLRQKQMQDRSREEQIRANQFQLVGPDFGQSTPQHNTYEGIRDPMEQIRHYDDVYSKIPVHHEMQDRLREQQIRANQPQLVEPRMNQNSRPRNIYQRVLDPMDRTHPNDNVASRIPVYPFNEIHNGRVQSVPEQTVARQHSSDVTPRFQSLGHTMTSPRHQFSVKTKDGASHLLQEKAFAEVIQPHTGSDRNVQSSRRQHMQSLDARLASFRGWPKEHVVTVESLANAGFYYLGLDDKVECAFCGGNLHQWEEGDDALSEHRRFYPDCTFALNQITQSLTPQQPVAEAKKAETKPKTRLPLEKILEVVENFGVYSRDEILEAVRILQEKGTCT